MALISILLMTSGPADGMTHRHQSTNVATVWSTHWQRSADPAQFRSALGDREAEAPPTLVGSTLYALGSDGRLYALDPRTGSSRTFDVGSRRRAITFRATSSRLLIVARALNPTTGLADTSLLGVDPTTRAVAWDQQLGADVFIDSLEVDADTVYLGVGDNVDGARWRVLRDRGAAPSLHPRVRAFALVSGALRWEQALPERGDMGPTDDLDMTAVGSEVVVTEFAGGVSGGVVGLDRVGGQIGWRDLSGTTVLGTLGNRLVALSGADVLILIATTGAIVDRLAGAGPDKPEATLVSGTWLYWTEVDTVRALDLQRKRQLWPPAQLDYRIRAVSRKSLTRLDIEDGHLYVGGRDDAVYSIDVRTGFVEWKFPAQRGEVPSVDYAPLRVGGLVVVQDSQLSAYVVPQ